MKHQVNRSLSKTLAIVLSAFTWLAMSVQSVCAQTLASSANSAKLSRVPDEIGPNYLRWRTASGSKAVAVAAGYGAQQPNAVESSMAKGMTDGSGVVQIESGMNYWDGRQWSPSDASFDLTDDAFVAQRVQQKTRLSAQLNVSGAVTTRLRDGTVLSSTPVGIALIDPDDGRIAIVGVLTNSTGYLVASNQVVYPDAFAGGICANVVYTLERGSFAQDIVITGHFDPVEWGFPTNSQLKIMTEFYSTPTPQKLVRPLYVEQNPAARQKKVSPDLMDEVLTFGDLGEWVMGTGKAYTAATFSNTNGMEAVVGKEFTTIQGRDMLIESVDCELLQDALKNLPLCAGSSGAGTLPRGTNSDIYASLPSPRSQAETAARPQRATTQFAAAGGAAGHGVVIDYIATLTGGTTVVLKHDTTYYVSGAVYCNSLVIEGGAICKYAAGASIVANGVTCETSSYRPAVFTALDDESIGESMQGKTGWTGQIHTHYANPAIRLNYTSGTLSNLRFCYAQEAVRFEGVSYTTATLEHSQLINCILGVGIAGYDGSGSGSGGGSGVLFTMNNCLLANLTNAVQHVLHGQSLDRTMLNNCTIDNALNLLGSGSGSDYFAAYFTNCVLSKIPGTSSQGTGFNGDYNGFYQTTMFIPGSQHYWTAASAPFHVAGGGDYYLDPANGANFLSKAATGIPSSLLTELSVRTTQAPVVLGTINSPTSEPPTGVPDSGALDLGYHYPILDYVCSQTAVSADLTFEPGTKVGWTGTGIIPDSYAQINFDGILANRCYFMPCNTIQEQAQASGGPGFTGNDYQPSLAATFTDFWALDGAAFFDAKYSLVTADNCEFWKGTLGGTVAASSGPFLTLQNCLLDASLLSLDTTENNGYCQLIMQNCTQHEGELTIQNNAGYFWYVYVEDCAFDGTIIDSTADSSAASDYNAYLTGVNPIKSGESHSFTVGSFNWQSGLLGDFYLPNDSPTQDGTLLINAGNQSADSVPVQVGNNQSTYLSSFTTDPVNQSYDTDTVDIGYHYPAPPVANNFSLGTMCPNDPPDSPQSSAPIYLSIYNNGWSQCFPDSLGLPITYTMPAQTQQGGTLQPDAWDGCEYGYIYTPPACYEGQDSFTYQMSDGFFTSSATATITVVDPVTADPPPVQTCRNTVSQPFTLGGHDNGCGEQLSYLEVSSPSHGYLTGMPGTADNPTYIYTPNDPNFTIGTDHFTYKVVNDCGDYAIGTVTITIVGAPDVIPAPIRSGFDQNPFGENDDYSVGPVNLPFAIDFYGSSFSSLYVNENGNVTFEGPFDSPNYGRLCYDPYISLAETAIENSLNIIAPFWGDVDSDNQCSALVTYGTNTVDGHTAFGVNWAYVGYFPAQVDKLNAFQLILIDRSDVAAGDFDVEFNYDQIQWESGAASGGTDGLGGDAARAGYASPSNSGFEFNCSDVDCPNVIDALLDSNPTTGLIYHDFNSTVPGRYVFQFRNGSPLGHP